MVQDPFFLLAYRLERSSFILKPQDKKDAGYCCELYGLKDVGFLSLSSSFRKIELSPSQINCLLSMADTNEVRFLSTDSENSVFCHVCSLILSIIHIVFLSNHI